MFIIIMVDIVKVCVQVPIEKTTRKKDGRVFENPPATIRKQVDKYRLHNVGVVGNYDNCTFSVRGVSRYHAIPGTDANPSIGEVGKLQETNMELIIFNVPKKALKQFLEDIVLNHPYEAPVIDVYELKDHKYSNYKDAPFPF
jgi:hypothetical protein